MKPQTLQDIRTAIEILTTATLMAAAVMFGLYLFIFLMLSPIDV